MRHYRGGVIVALLLVACAAPQINTRRPQIRELAMTREATQLCPQHFAGREAPTLTTSEQAGDLVELCYSYFSVLHASGWRTAVWSAERLTADMARASERISGRPGYHVESELAAEDRAATADYRGSGWQVGHMTPSDDMPDRDSQWETFTLANMAPQAGRLNTVLWQHLEASINELAETRGELFIVTGPIFSANPTYLNGRVAVPQYIFKAVYAPSTDDVIVFLVQNRDNARCHVISLDDLERRLGYEVFPGLADLDRDDPTIWDLPRGPRTPAPRCS